ncbi:IclR family transcriptional regulator [Micromonospora sonchi]|uniref:IclR family transcriptional regulator n=1 Tax=Micromonospora sonchi TaxID=1763543 RepID=A0A917X3U3_9ACTN|nr:IclR family transcriptional regulator [Micromonospora sonchi]GGM62309.1 IclR family transcriptional regulator [Micromonospora sonchi]
MAALGARPVDVKAVAQPEATLRRRPADDADPENADGAARARSGLARTFSIINLLASRAPETLGVSAIARDLQMPKAVAHRILKELVAGAFLVFDTETKQYQLGPGALTVGLAALRTLDVPKTARPYLVRLVEVSGETATLSIRQGWQRVYVDQVLSPHEVRMSVALGRMYPLHAGSSSKAILAALPDEVVEEFLTQHKRVSLTPRTIISADELRDDIAGIRERGYAVSFGERQAGAGSVAAAIRNALDEVVGAISLCGPRERLAENALRHGAEVVEAARAVSRDIGYRGPG